MRQAWMPAACLISLLASAIPAPAESGTEAGVSAGQGAVVAMDNRGGRALRAGEIFTNEGEPALLVTRRNLRMEIAPHAVVEVGAQGDFRLLRGAAVLEARTETAARTASAQVDFVGRLLLSYDHKEHSTSAFVLDGEARIENPQQPASSLRLSRFHGAALVAGDVLPQAVEQLGVGAVDSWLAGFSWPEARRRELLKQVPGQPAPAVAEVPRHLDGAKIEDYFSSIDTADEFHQPRYYEKKFADPDTVMAEAKANKGAARELTPEEAALISLPSTKIDLGLDLGPEFLTAHQKALELRRVQPAHKAASRRLASVSEPAGKAPVRKAPEAPRSETGDAEVDQVLERLRALAERNHQPSRVPASGRGPASVGAVVSDPAYDYSQNF